jgi:hemolysin D
MDFQIHLSAWRDLLGKYRNVWRAAWAQRAQLQRPDRTAEEAEFLPAALAVQDTPVSPTLGWGLRGIVIFFLLALIGACVFHIDVVISGQGTIIPSGHVKAVQSLEAGVVRRISVSEGQKVRQGEVLVELFSPGISTDSARHDSERLALREELQRLLLFGQWLDHGASVAGTRLSTAAPGPTNLLQARFGEFLDRKDRAEAELDRRRAEVISASEAMNKVLEAIPRLQSKADDYRDLLAQGYVSRHSALDQQQMLADARADMNILESRRAEARASLAEAGKARAQLVSELRRTVLEQQRDYEMRLSAAEQEYQKNKDRDELMVIRAPIDGEVSHLMTYTLGGVIPAAQTLMNIVPDGLELEIEAVIDNQDIGHIRAGQEVQIKVQSFPFGRYGLMSGQVKGISATAAMDEKKGAIYKARISMPNKLQRQTLFPHPLVAGMDITVEVKIGHRRVIEYFMSPMLTAVREAGREW